MVRRVPKLAMQSKHCNKDGKDILLASSRSGCSGETGSMPGQAHFQDF